MVVAAVAGTVVAAGATAYAGNQAANATKNASNAAISEQQAALQQQAQMSAPYRSFGESAIPTLQSLLGLTGPAGPTSGAVPQGAAPQQQGGGAGFTLGGQGQIGHQLLAGGGAAGGAPAGPSGAVPTPTGLGAPVGAVQTATGPVSAGSPADPGGGGGIAAGLANDPMYQFAQQQGTQGTINAATAQGLGLSGNTLEGLSKFNQGLASETYQQYVGDLMGAVGVGQAAAAGQAANIGNAAGNISNTLYNQGQTQAGIDVNTTAGITKAIGGGINNITRNQTLAGLQAPGGSPAVSADPTSSINYSYGPGSVGTTTNFEDPSFGIGSTTNFEGGG